MKNKSLLIYIGIVGATSFLIVGGWSVFRASPQASPQIIADSKLISADTGDSENQPLDFARGKPPIDSVRGEAASEEISTLLNVPFTSQAPTGNWDNIVFQQGCEEASMLMAMLWAEKKSFISPNEAEKAIFAISNFSQKNYGEFRDTSAWDTARIMRDYFDYENIEVKNDIDTADIKKELADGNLVIVPVNGQKLGNPFYTPPGPIQHMLVVRGYDADKKEFIVNDPGTKRGEAFRYKEDILEGALQDYVTGYKEPIADMNKAMIIVYAKPA